MSLKNIISVSALVAVILSGCTVTIDEIVDRKVNTISAQIDRENTKTAVTDEGYFTWSSGDKIWLHTTTGSIVGTLSSGQGTPDADFTYDSFFGELTGKSVYPYNEGHYISEDGLSVVLPSVYELGSALQNTNAIMYGVAVDNALKFTHMAGVMRFTLNNVPAGVNQFKLTLDKKICGVFTADLSESHPSIVTSETDDQAEKTITLNFDPLTAVSNINLYFPLPVGTYNLLALELNNSTETVWEYSNAVTNTVNRKDLLLMPEVTMPGTVDGAIENDAFDRNVYITYESDSYQVTSGDSYWLMRPFLLSRVSSIGDIEMKFQMSSDDKAYLFYSERPYVHNGAFLNEDGLRLRYNNRGYNVTDNELLVTWEEMDVEPTDCIVMRISVYDGTLTVNGKTIHLPQIAQFTDIEYLFSSYFYEDDDGYAKTYAAVPIGSKLYYAKIYNASGEVVYTGHASEGEYNDGTIQYAWKSVHSDQTYMEFARTNFEPFWVRTYAYMLKHFGGGVDSGEGLDGKNYVDLSASGTANSYIVTEAGSYKFTPTKGNSSESVGAIASVEVLWETFGTDVAPEVGDLVKKVKYEDGAICFETPASFVDGNASIAAKDASGTILWSWHIWLTDEPDEQVYYNDAGTMMDRNLGATSATPGDVGALGLLYQWGRKDPFLSSSSISENITAESTISWPSAVSSNSSVGTIEYATSNPTTFITNDSSNNYDWYYTGSSSTDNTRWTESNTEKSIYDPCPSGWRVPDGGANGVWSKAFGSTLDSESTYDNTNEGMDFSGKFGSDQIIWYPASGYRRERDGSLYNIGDRGYCWSASPAKGRGFYANDLNFGIGDYLSPAFDYFRALGQAVRCIKEGTYTYGAPAAYTLQLKPTTYGWIKSTSVSNPDPSVYDGVYESTNQGYDSTQSYMYIDIEGYETFKLYVRSYAESSYDYVVVSNLDCTLSSSTTSGSNVKMTTKSNQKSDTSINGYTLVEFTGIDKGEHRITVMYYKDVSQSVSDDKGYVLIPKNQ